MNPHRLPSGTRYYTYDRGRAEEVAASHNSTVGEYSLGDDTTAPGVIDPIKGGFILIDWFTGKRSHLDPVSS